MNKKQKIIYLKGNYDIMTNLVNKTFLKRLHLCLYLVCFPNFYKNHNLKPLREFIKKIERKKIK